MAPATDMQPDVNKTQRPASLPLGPLSTKQDLRVRSLRLANNQVECKGGVQSPYTMQVCTKLCAMQQN